MLFAISLVRRPGPLTPNHSTREVTFSAGAVGSPQILQLSGIGPADLLQQHGIAVQADVPGVGGNLQDHLQIRAVFKVRGVKTLNTLANSLWGKAKIGLEYALRRSGPMSMAPSQLGAFTRSSPEMRDPNVEYHVQPLSLDPFGEPLHSFPAFTASVCNLNPTSRGTVRIRSANFQDAPAIAPNYLSTPEDRQVAADSLRLTRRIVAQPALAKYQPEEYKPGLQYQSDEELARLERRPQTFRFDGNAVVPVAQVPVLDDLSPHPPTPIPVHQEWGGARAAPSTPLRSRCRRCGRPGAAGPPAGRPEGPGFLPRPPGRRRAW